MIGDELQLVHHSVTSPMKAPTNLDIAHKYFVLTGLDRLGMGSPPTLIPRHPLLPWACRMHDLGLLPCAGSEDKLRVSTANKARVRMLQCVIMALDRNPVEFAAFLPPFLSLYSTNALTAPDAAGVYALPAKRRVLLTTFLARALVCPHYEPDMIKFIKIKGGAWVLPQLAA